VAAVNRSDDGSAGDADYGAAVHDRFTAHLSRDLADGTWDERHGHLRTLPAFDGSLTLVVSQP
jgi:hypothetical protein